jgi:hypothetical protein
VTWEQREAMSPDEIREWGLWPKGFPPTASLPTYRRPGVSKGGDRRDKAAGRARPDPQREDFVRTVPDRHHVVDHHRLHDERLLTPDDTVEFFNLVLGDKLTAKEKQDLVAFMRAL